MKTPVLIGFFNFFALTVVWSQIMQPPPKDSFDIIVVFEEGTLSGVIESTLRGYGAKEKWVTPITKARLWRLPNIRRAGDPTYWISYSGKDDGLRAVERARRKTTGVELNRPIFIPEMSNTKPFKPSSCKVDLKRFVVRGDENRGPAKPAKIAILDTGLGCNPKDTYCVTPDNVSAFISTSEGYNFTIDYPSVNIYADNNGHGLGVASLIALNMSDPKIHQIVPVKVLKSDGLGTMYALIQGIDYAIQRNVDIINISIVANVGSSGDISSTPLARAISQAEKHGILVVCAAGNDGRKIDDQPLLPACVPNDNVLTVGAELCINKPAFFSNFGAIQVDIFAPGENIGIPDLRGGPIRYASGTSYATPIVAGVAFALRTYSGRRSWQQLKCAIMRGAYIGSDSAFRSHCVSGGTIDVTTAWSWLRRCP